MGKVVGDKLQCGYHGLEFDASGRCVKVPGQSKIPPGAEVRSYPVLQEYGWVWIWTGDPAKAELTKFGLVVARKPRWRTIPGRGGTPMHLNANYLLVSDNLFDISHLTYVHASSIGADSIVDFPVKTERWEDEKRVKMSRVIYDRPAAPFYQKAGQFEGNVDRWIMTTSDLPCYMASDAGSVEVGTGVTPGEVGPERGVEMKIMNLPTPETETSTHCCSTAAILKSRPRNGTKYIARSSPPYSMMRIRPFWKASSCECLNFPTRQKSTSTLMRLTCRCAA